MAPTSTTPWIALAPDISGVCSVAGTLLITSKPTSRLSTKMVMSANSSGLMRALRSAARGTAGCTTSPSWVTTTPAVISSARSIAERAVA